MEDTMLIQVTNIKAVTLLHNMADIKLIKVLKENIATATMKTKLSDKYRGIINKEQEQEFNDHIQQMRSEWNNI